VPPRHKYWIQLTSKGWGFVDGEWAAVFGHAVTIPVASATVNAVRRNHLIANFCRQFMTDRQLPSEAYLRLR